MAQLNPGDWPLSGNEVGADFVTKMESLFYGMMSNWSGAVRMPEVIDSGVWTRENVDGGHTLMLYSNGNDVELISSTPDGGATAKYFYTKTEVDNLLSQQAASLAALGEVPIGGIIMWAGSTSSIPSRFRLCNGANGTPDLTDRFIVGAGDSYSVGQTGGQNSITDVPRHNHSFSGSTGNAGNHDHGGDTASAGAHSHTYTAFERTGSEDRLDTANSNFTEKTRSTSTTGSHKHDISTDGNHNHNFSGTTNNAGESSVDIRPLYYAMAFIQRKT